MQRWPAPKAMKRIRNRVHELTDQRQSGKDVKQVIATLNPVLRGWGQYFRTSHTKKIIVNQGVCRKTASTV
jgi:RNA-directed DNA polymerase